ncbi:hypothetical protein Skr01_63130 [Sphaerisporangium krabiense]|uniref:NTF2-like N-terminal transpeptidase domain-containing protein n=1 Tax=Sphaerisporangium krabiense TaxID=763782 RepID=A0A7W8Z686_9ACTN|nr:NTF2-like N-terminal transpeptidase domain-containing protein [Sphaerisporangium krabiense]MBB5628233.1 hypothetical protein [Sphaerisporangium krabiense]GII66228.1 hypothetical protein Skr01_63130 [Sphaerisporangium krabiense]
MRRRGLLALVALCAVLLVAGVTAVIADARRVTGSPEATGRAYLDAWTTGNPVAMRELVASPPADFLEAHRRFSTDLQVLSVKLTPGAVVARGAQAADLPFTGVRQIGELGEWRFSSVLHLAVRNGAWKVLWTPATLLPGVAADERLRLARISLPGTELLTRQGRPLPHDSGAKAYFDGLAHRVDLAEEDPASGWAVEAVSTRTGTSRSLVVFRPPMDRTLRTTVDWWTQAAAARALDGLATPAAIVAVRPSTGEVLAVADRLPGLGAFYTAYPATFARLVVERLKDGGLRRAAAGLGFGGALTSGFGGVCGTVRAAGTAGAPAVDAAGRDAVTATPVCMALMAAAVRNGAWRPPRLMSERAVGRLETARRPAPRRLPAKPAAWLRRMMAAAGTAAGLPPGVAGAAGTAPAESGAGHAWCVGYRGDLAFAVFVENGGTGAASAVPAAVRFLDAL